MVAERAVGQAAHDLRGEFGLKFQEVMETITGVKNEIDGELISLRDELSTAFKENNKTIRAEITTIGDNIQAELTKQIEKYNIEIGTEVGKVIVESNKEHSKVVENKLREKEETMQKQLDLLEININESLDNIKKNGMSHAGTGTRDNSKSSDDWNGKGSRYGFDKEYKLDPTDRWSDTSTVGFRNSKVWRNATCFPPKLNTPMVLKN